MESDLHREREHRLLGRFSGDRNAEGLSELELAKRQLDELNVENRQLKKAMDESEKRTVNIKSSLNATEESLRRLIEAVKAGKSAAGAGADAIVTSVGGVTADVTGGASMIRLDRIEADRSEIVRLRNQLNEACTRGSEAERQLIERNFECSRLKEVSFVL